MEQCTIISSTNRPGSFSLRFSALYRDLMGSKSQLETKILSLESLPPTFAFDNCFGKRTPDFEVLLENYIVNAQRFVFVIPEYNGSFPGILKSFLDASQPKSWYGKKAALIGVSQGRAGNLRGIEQFTLILQHLRMHVYFYKLPVSNIEKIIGQNPSLPIPEEMISLLNLHINGFCSF